MSRVVFRRNNEEAVMKAFAERVIRAARLNLGATRSIRYNDGSFKRRRNVSTGKLKDTITSVTGIAPHPAVDFFFERYGVFLDEGVDGVKYRAPGNSRFSFRKRQPPTRFIEEWMRQRRIKVRDLKTGQFIKQSAQNKKTAAFLIGRSIKQRGIPKTEWFSQAFRQELDKLPPEFLEALNKDVEEFLKEVKPF